MSSIRQGGVALFDVLFIDIPCTSSIPFRSLVIKPYVLLTASNQSKTPCSSSTKMLTRRLRNLPRRPLQRSGLLMVRPPRRIKLPVARSSATRHEALHRRTRSSLLRIKSLSINTSCMGSCSAKDWRSTPRVVAVSGEKREKLGNVSKVIRAREDCLGR